MAINRYKCVCDVDYKYSMAQTIETERLEFNVLHAPGWGRIKDVIKCQAITLFEEQNQGDNVQEVHIISCIKQQGESNE